MAILIGHASIDENGRARGGIAGDQTGREVCTRQWYSKPWNFVLRCKDSKKAEKMAKACEKGCSNNNIGYDQNQRNSLNAQAKKVGYDLSKISTPCECDCSSFMTVCAQAAGINIPYNGGNAPATFTMQSAFLSTGEFEVLTDSKYLTSDSFLKRGDILVNISHHTAMALQNGANYKAPAKNSSIYTRKQFIMDVQSATGSKVDGIAGPETLRNTVTVSATKNRKHPVVVPLQKELNALCYNCGAVDGIAGPKFTASVKRLQKDRGCVVDGEITARNKTWKSLLGMI